MKKSLCSIVATGVLGVMAIPAQAGTISYVEQTRTISAEFHLGEPDNVEQGEVESKSASDFEPFDESVHLRVEDDFDRDFVEATASQDSVLGEHAITAEGRLVVNGSEFGQATSVVDAVFDLTESSPFLLFLHLSDVDLEDFFESRQLPGASLSWRSPKEKKTS